jgi:hypothetical protein
LFLFTADALLELGLSKQQSFRRVVLADRPWVGTEPPVTTIDRQLFRASTVVTLGDGGKASFWQSTWLQGQETMDLFPELFKYAWRKNRTVKEELLNQNWVRGLSRMQTIEEMADFVKLWDLVQEVQLTSEPDQIAWRWTADGVYTAKISLQCTIHGIIQPVQW